MADYTDSIKAMLARQAKMPSATQEVKDASAKANGVTQPVTQQPTQQPTSQTSMQVQQPAFDMQGFVNAFTQQAKAQAEADQRARDAIIQARLATQIADEENNINTENANFVKNTTQTREDIYNAQENNRAQGVQRGIQYSQQQQAIEVGTSLAGEKMIKQAQADRDTRIANIKNKISALRTGASYEMQASQAQSQSQVSQATQNATSLGYQRQWQTEDSNTAYQRELALRGVDKQTQIDLFNMGEASKEKFFKMDEDSKMKFFNMEEASKEKFFKMDEASKEKFFNMDTDRQKMFFDLNEASKEKFWKLDAQQQEKMFSMNAGLQKEMFNLESAQQVKMLGLQHENAVALNYMSHQNQLDIMKESAKLDQQQLDAKVKAEANRAKAETMSNYLVNSPTFSAYPSAKEIVKSPEKVQQLSAWMDTNGVPKEEQYRMISGQMDASWWDKLWNRDDKALKSLKSILGVK